MDKLEQYFQDDFCTESDDALKARLQNRLQQQIFKTKQVVRFPRDVFAQALEARSK